MPAGCNQISDAEYEARPIPVVIVPDNAGFIQAVKTGLGGIVAANQLSVAYPLFFAAATSSDWADVQALVIDAQAKSAINSTQYAAIKSAAAANNIPITL